MAPLQELLEKIAKEFLFGKLANIVATATWCYEAAASSNVLNKLEGIPADHQRTASALLELPPGRAR